MSAAIPCPRCRQPLEPHSRTCPACGGSALREKLQGESTATCAMHPERVASAACERCGVFGCAICLTVAGEAVVCRKCRPAPAPHLAWEDPSRNLIVRFLSTAWAFSTQPMSSAREVKGGSILWAWLFAGLCLLSQAVTLAAVTGLAEAGATRRLSFAGTVVLGAVAWLFVLPMGEFLTLRAMGISIPLETQLRASAYSTAGFVVPFCACALLPLWGPLVRVASLRATFQLSWAQALLAAGALPLCVACTILLTRADLSFWV